MTENGIEPAPERSRKTSWKDFLKANWDCLTAADFFTVGVWSWRGLVTYYALIFIDLATRRVYVGGITPNPNTGWIMQIGRNLTDPIDGFLRDKSFLVIDRDRKHCEAFRHLLVAAGIKPVRLPPQSPNLNAHAERFVRSIKEEYSNRLILFGERSLRYAIAEYLDHYHRERPHEGLGNRLLVSSRGVERNGGDVKCRERLGGLLRSYRRKAA